jgi:hypothetical protein
MVGTVGEEPGPAVTKNKEGKKTKKKCAANEKLAPGDDLPIFYSAGDVDPKYL